MRRGRASVLLFFFVSLLLLAAYYFLHSPYFGVSQVNVQGISLINQEEIVKLSGIHSGENIWRLDTQRIKQQLLFHPQVETVEIHRQWPSTVLIEIKERKPIAVVGQAGSFILIDQQGIFLRKVESIYGIPLPIITGVQVPLNAGPGQPIDAEGLPVALKVSTELTSSVLARVGEIHVSAGHRLILYTEEGLEVRFGTAEDIPAKGDMLTEMLKQLTNNGGSEKIQYIDISSPKAPVVKPRETNETKKEPLRNPYQPRSNKRQ
ncbi:FtsQ-type POTRA domain-containing protein [Heliobacillus mobilis]|uniref:FtsQ-type POTRA domain-containing protein n=1 Tax=Heliobacterium mobile TaxID=28064 RepID=A0A6I3SG09_HELMO|nr:FtsQ-type POTRA domain-containing protein [Heliobacterium mobile]MTV47564.1 FtsQ-type POTRA domain-containing protein [Heliobacterium mobile]